MANNGMTVQQLEQLYGSLTPGVGQKYQRIEGTGAVNNDLNRWLQNANYADFVRGNFSNSTGVGYQRHEKGGPNGENWMAPLGNAQDGESASAAGSLLINNDPSAYVYSRSDNSRFDDGLNMRNYFDDKGKHLYSDISNDPAGIGKFTSGDLQFGLSGLAAMGGLMFLGPMLSAAAAGGGLGGAAAGSGAGFIGEGAASGIGAWDGALAGATAGEVGGAAAGGLGAVDLTGTGLPLDGAGSVIGSQAGGGTLSNAEIMNMINGGGFSMPSTGSGSSGGSGGAGKSGGLLNGKAFNIPGIGDVSWGDLLKVGSLLGGGLAGSEGNKQTQTSTRELPDYLKGPVTGQNGLLASADRLMQHQLYGTPFAPR